VMELVEGDDLAQLIAAGPLPVGRAVGLAIQITDALEAAHAQQIIHRDLKPANIKVRTDGKVKLLDFGIAKVFEEGRPDDETAAGAPVTQVGHVVGTLPYMSPEQTTGQPVDKRTDIWAFGCVLYEMLTGRAAFQATGVQSRMSAILERDVDWTLLPRDTPPGVRRVLRRCLIKDASRRLADIADARLDLDEKEPVDTTAASTHPAAWRWLPIVSAAVVGAVLAATGAIYSTRLHTSTSPAAVASLAILPPPGERLISGVRAVNISSDGSRIALSTDKGLYLRTLDSFELRPLGGSRMAVGNLAFAPDSRHIAVIGLDGIQSIDVTTGGTERLPVPRVNQAGVLGSLRWTEQGLLGAFGGGGVWLLRNDAWQQLIQLDASEATSSAQLLPDGEHVLLTILRLADPQRTGDVVIQDVKSGARIKVAERASDAVYFANAYITYVKDGVLLAHPFDVVALKPTGAPVRLVDGVQSANNINATMQYGLSTNGTLAYVPGQAMPAALAMDLVVSDRQGHVEHLHLPAAPYETPRISPDGRMLAVSTNDGTDASVWVRDLAGASSTRRLTTGARNRFPVWSADGKRIAFQSNREGDLAIYAQAADGSDAPARLTTAAAGVAHLPESWSTTHLLYSAMRGDSVTLWALSLADRRSVQIPGATSSSPLAATFSPNGRWIAYNTAAASGVYTTYVRPFPPTGEIHEISHNDDGHHPVWTRDGQELIFIPGPRQLFAVKMQFTPSFSFSPPELLPPAGLMGPGNIPRNFDILPDGNRFIGREIAEDEKGRTGSPQRIEVVTNLLELIAKRR